jgi:hypothetical protein
VVRYQRCSSEVLSKPLVALIAAALTWRDSCPHPMWSERVVRLLVLPAVAGLSVVIHHPAPPGTPAGVTKRLEIKNQ